MLTTRKLHLRKRSLSDITAFVEEEIIIVNDLLFSNNAVEQYLDKIEISKRGVEVLYDEDRDRRVKREYGQDV